MDASEKPVICPRCGTELPESQRILQKIGTTYYCMICWTPIERPANGDADGDGSDPEPA